MAFSDNDPERRNLVITSMAFLIYFWGGGEIVDNSIHLQAVNIKLNNPEVLAVLSWVMLLWFALRYWQVHRSKLHSALYDETYKKRGHPVLIWYFKNKLKKPYKKENGFDITEVRRHVRLGWKVKTGLIRGGQEASNGIWCNYRIVNDEEHQLSGFSGFIMKSIVLISIALTLPGIGSWFLPYFIFVLAVISGIASVCM